MPRRENREKREGGLQVEPATSQSLRSDLQDYWNLD